MLTWLRIIGRSTTEVGEKTTTTTTTSTRREPSRQQHLSRFASCVPCSLLSPLFSLTVLLQVLWVGFWLLIPCRLLFCYVLLLVLRLLLLGWFLSFFLSLSLCGFDCSPPLSLTQDEQPFRAVWIFFFFRRGVFLRSV